MSDQELLELAAMAAGLYDAWPEPECSVQWSAEGAGLWCSGEGRGMLWNPLEDDGDALRLAYLARITWGACETGAVWARCEMRSRVFKEPIAPDGDGVAALRRAIVRAAADMVNPPEPATPAASAPARAG